jgi:hypothetical protein
MMIMIMIIIIIIQNPFLGLLKLHGVHTQCKCDSTVTLKSQEVKDWINERVTNGNHSWG